MEEGENDPEVKTMITQSRAGHSQILHVRQDSANELDQLFNVSLNPSNRSKSLPMKYRKLPKSFFEQPERPRPSMHAHSRSVGGLSTVSHSRSSSTDSSASHQSGLNVSSTNLHQQSLMHANNSIGQRTGNFTPQPIQQHRPFNNSPGHVTGLQVPQISQISHSKSKSSPASLQMNLVAPSNAIEIPPDMPLPQGWEFAKTLDGQTYFMNHTNRTTTWIDPRIEVLKEEQSRVSNMQEPSLPQPPMHANSTGMHNNEQSVSQQISTLPRGWEQATTAQGEIYFINHETRVTSWLDPRLPQNVNMQHTNQSQLNAQMRHQVQKMNQLDISSQFNQQRSSHMIINKLAKDKEMMMKMRQREMLKQSGMDPFLGTGSSSGGGSFDHTRASNEYLDSVEEMETDSGNHNQHGTNHQQQNLHASIHQQQRGHMQHTQANNQPHFPDFLDSLPASSVDFSNDSGNQQSEDLVPTIGETLSNDFINDVESMLNPVVKSENMDSMTWL